MVACENYSDPNDLLHHLKMCYLQQKAWETCGNQSFDESQLKENFNSYPQNFYVFCFMSLG